MAVTLTLWTVYMLLQPPRWDCTGWRAEQRRLIPQTALRGAGMGSILKDGDILAITSNEGGVLKTLSQIPSNEGGVLYNLDKVHSNEGGVLYEIFSGVSFPTSLTWTYIKSSSQSPVVQQNGMYAENKRTDGTSSDDASIKSCDFEIKSNVQLHVVFKISMSYMTGGGGYNIYNSDTEKQAASGGVSASDDYTVEKTHALSPGRYYITCQASGGGPSGSGPCRYSITLTFTKA